MKAHRAEFAGEATAHKLARIQEALAKAKVDALVVSDPHALAWTFNIRGGDVEHTPLPLGYAIVPREGRPTVFLAPEKITNEAGDAIGAVGEIAPPAALEQHLQALGAAKAKVRLDSTTAASALATLIREAGGTPDAGADPIALMKARKNEAELKGARDAHLRDGAAMVRFLSWLAREAPKGGLTEIDAVAALEAERLKTGLLKDVSFTTIAGAGPNAALPHYRVTEASNRRIEPGIFLVDSGGQYEDGTTDITRTIADRRAERRDARPLYPRAQGPSRDLARRLRQGHLGRAARRAGAAAALAGRARFRPRHRPWRRQLSLGA